MNNNLKKLTLEAHHNAERKKFANLLLSGNITPQLYHQYLYNQYHNYMALESKINIPEINDIKRHEYIKQDLEELEKEYSIEHNTNLCSSTEDYIRYVDTLDQYGLIAHLYVRHFGDMYGGQIIKKRTPGSGSMYDFENVEELKQKVRNMLADNMAEEANQCFNFAIRLFEELLPNE